MGKKDQRVDNWLVKQGEWRSKLETLREILNASELDETIKWGVPGYVLDGKNIVGINAFKNYAGIWFHQGVFLSDPENVLYNANPESTRGLRQWRFGPNDEIPLEKVTSYIEEAIINQKKGRTLKPKAKPSIPVPAELAYYIDRDEQLKAQWNAFSKSHRREYSEYVAEAKKSETRERRAKKAVEMITAGKGLHDKYR